MLREFYAKLKLKPHGRERFMAAHGKGTRNESGERLASYVSHTELNTTNTTFQMKMRHQSS